MTDPRVCIATVADTAVVEAFDALASEQRGEPEVAMSRLQHAIGGGTFFVCVEHVGDLTNRMAKAGHMHDAGHQYVENKVKYYLPAVRRLADTDEYQQNLHGNAAFAAQEDGTDPVAYIAKVERARVRYVEAHRRLVVYNRAQYLARQAAVNLGGLNFTQAYLMLSQLKEMLEPMALFDLKMATEYDYEQAARDLDEEQGEENWLPDQKHDRAWLIAERRWRTACREAWTRTALEYLPGPDGLPRPYPWRY